jgi:undecaprenyl diphosphate synthase
MDGNKRWAKNKKLTIIDAYSEGIDNVLRISEKLIEKEIKYLSVYALSTENVKRKSVNLLFNSIFDKFYLFLNKLINEKSIKIKVIGERDNLPIKLKKIINEAEQKTINHKKLTLILAFNYGFESELISVFKKLYKQIQSVNSKEINNIKFDNLFYLNNIPDPDILIRTGGYQRLSNYLMYNLCYTELFFTKTLWPDFKKKELEKIIKEFKNISRNYGL